MRSASSKLQVFGENETSTVTSYLKNEEPLAGALYGSVAMTYLDLMHKP